MRWEWDVEGRIVTAELSLFTGREIVAVDGTPAFDRFSWKFRSEFPLDLEEGKEARVVAWSRWGLLPACVLEIDGVRAEPRLVGSVRQLPWWGKLFLIGLGVLLVSESVFLIVVPGVHRIRGGATLPPARWSEADLVSLPPDDANAWHLIADSGSIPEFNLDRALLGKERIPEGEVGLVDLALQQPSVADVLHQAAELGEWSKLALPSPIDQQETSLALRLRAWHDWVLVSLKRKIDREPAAAAGELSVLIPMWIQCANLAREGLDHVICAIEARRDLELVPELGGNLYDQGARARLANAIREAPPLSSRNALIAEYIAAYRGLDLYRRNGKRAFRLWMDLERTQADIDQTFATLAAGKPCQEREITLWRYNWGGEVFARILTVSPCVWGPRSVEMTGEVAELRRQALSVLSEGSN